MLRFKKAHIANNICVYQNLPRRCTHIKATFTLFIAGIMTITAQAYEPDHDYLEDMVAAAVAGDMEAGYAAQQLRDEKIMSEELAYTSVDFEVLYYVSKLTEAECGAPYITDRHQKLTAQVLLNRIDSPEFPNSVTECLYQTGQYYPESDRHFQAVQPSERVVRNVLELLEGERVAPASVVFQANFSQGSGTYEKIYVSFLNNYSYFCYSIRPEVYAEDGGFYG